MNNEKEEKKQRGGSGRVEEPRDGPLNAATLTEVI